MRELMKRWQDALKAYHNSPLFEVDEGGLAPRVFAVKVVKDDRETLTKEAKAVVGAMQKLAKASRSLAADAAKLVDVDALLLLARSLDDAASRIGQDHWFAQEDWGGVITQCDDSCCIGTSGAELLLEKLALLVGTEVLKDGLAAGEVRASDITGGKAPGVTLVANQTLQGWVERGLGGETLRVVRVLPGGERVFNLEDVRRFSQKSEAWKRNRQSGRKQRD